MRKIIIFIIITLPLFLSCVKEEIIESKDNQDMILLNAQLYADDTEHTVYVGIGNANIVRRLTLATVTCSVNGGDPVKAELSNALYSTKIQSEYKFNANFASGDVVKITAAYGGMKASAEVTVPESAGEIVQIDSVMKGGNVFFTVKVKDNFPGRNYYRLRLTHKYTARVYSQDSPKGEIQSGSNNVMLDNDDDPILNGGKLDDTFFVESSYNKYCLFHDSFFQQGTCSINVSAKLNEMYALTIKGDFTYVRVKNQAVMSLVSITRPEYDYLRYLNILEDADYDYSNLLESLVNQNNVEGGLGFVSVSSEHTFPFRLEDTEF